MPLAANIEVPAGQKDGKTFRVRLRIVQQGGDTSSILNPDMGRPSAAMNWPWSQETYQTSLLISFGYLSVSVNDETGHSLPQQPIQTWATPVLRTRLELKPGDSLDLEIPIGDFYELESGRAYSIGIEFGDQAMKVAASEQIVVP